MRWRLSSLLSPAISGGISRMAPSGAAGRVVQIVSKGSCGSGTSSQGVALSASYWLFTISSGSKAMRLPAGSSLASHSASGSLCR